MRPKSRIYFSPFLLHFPFLYKWDIYFSSFTARPTREKKKTTRHVWRWHLKHDKHSRKYSRQSWVRLPFNSFIWKLNKRHQSVFACQLLKVNIIHMGKDGNPRCKRSCSPCSYSHAEKYTSVSTKPFPLSMKFPVSHDSYDKSRVWFLRIAYILLIDTGFTTKGFVCRWTGGTKISDWDKT